jgi:hypothetical protein
VSVEQRFPALCPRRWLAAVTAAVLTAGLGAMLAIAFPATARASTPASAGQQIATALRTSPVYVDPSLSSAFPAAVRASLLQQIRKAPAPVFVLAVPLVAGGQWPSGGQLATVVHNYLGRAGIYLTIDATFSSDIDAFTWPSDPQGIDAAPYHAADAAQAANLAQDMQNATLPQKFIEAIELIRNGQAVSAYQAAVRQLNANSPGQPSAQPAAHRAGSGPWPVLIAVIVLVVLAVGGGGWLLTRRRRKPSPFVAPHAVFSAARTASEAELREQAQQQVIALGELVEAPGPLAAAGPLSEQAQAQLGQALDAYQAAGKVLDQASGLCDLAGVLVLTQVGRNAAEAAEAAQAGRPVPTARPLCFFNPLHGPAGHEIRWRALGERETLDVHVCDDCARAAAQHRLPDVLVDRAAGQEVPYYEVDPKHSVWAATGYGQFADDLVQRILTRGVHPAR